MNILILNPKSRKLRYSFFMNGKQIQLRNNHLCYNTYGKALFSWDFLLGQISADLTCTPYRVFPDAIAIRAVFGASEFDSPTIVTDSVIKKIERLIPRAPIHLPRVLELIQKCRAVFSTIPIVLVFETAFFTSLPPREHKYALDNEMMLKSGFRRYGYRGIYHQAACRYVQSELRKREHASALKILSICLDPHPEIAAVSGNSPIMITSGSTPLEGLPGERSSGEIDPSIVTMLANKKNWGPEKINEILTRESGLYGLTDSSVSLGEIIASHSDEHRLARNILKYRLVFACGAGIAALGGLDAVVFSGRYAYTHASIEQWLREKLNFRGGLKSDTISFVLFADSLDRIIAENASFTVLHEKAV